MSEQLPEPLQAVIRILPLETLVRMRATEAKEWVAGSFWHYVEDDGAGYYERCFVGHVEGFDTRSDGEHDEAAIAAYKQCDRYYKTVPHFDSWFKELGRAAAVPVIHAALAAEISRRKEQ